MTNPPTVNKEIVMRGRCSVCGAVRNKPCIDSRKRPLALMHNERWNAAYKLVLKKYESGTT